LLKSSNLPTVLSEIVSGAVRVIVSWILQEFEV